MRAVLLYAGYQETLSEDAAAAVWTDRRFGPSDTQAEDTMTIQARFSEHDPRLYSLNRDLAHNFASIMEEVVKSLSTKRWPALAEYLEASKIGDRELADAVNALCHFIASQSSIKGESMAWGLARCNFLEQPTAAKVAVMATLGQIVLGVHWAGVKEATLGGKGPAMTYQQLRWHGAMMVKLMRLPRWRRRLYKWWRRVRLALRRLRGGGE
jgi:hypothetical protein